MISFKKYSNSPVWFVLWVTACVQVVLLCTTKEQHDFVFYHLAIFYILPLVQLLLFIKFRGLLDGITNELFQAIDTRCNTPVLQYSQYKPAISNKWLPVVFVCKWTSIALIFAYWRSKFRFHKKAKIRSISFPSIHLAAHQEGLDPHVENPSSKPLVLWWNRRRDPLVTARVHPHGAASGRLRWRHV